MPFFVYSPVRRSYRRYSPQWPQGGAAGTGNKLHFKLIKQEVGNSQERLLIGEQVKWKQGNVSKA